MKRNRGILVSILSVVFTILFASCCKTYQCSPYVDRLFRISNFTTQESDTIIVRAYKKGSGFTQKLDSVLLAKDKNSIYLDLGDGISTEVSINVSENFELSSLYDFEFYFPATNTLRRLSEITDRQSEIKQCNPSQRNECRNQLASSKLDGVLFTATNPGSFPYLLK